MTRHCWPTVSAGSWHQPKVWHIVLADSVDTADTQADMLADKK